MIVPGRLHPDPDRAARGQDLTDPIDRRPQRRAGHRELDRTEQPDPTVVGHRQRRRPLTDIDRDHDRRQRGSKLDWHDPPPGTPEGHGAANARPSMRNLTRFLLAPPEVSVKDYGEVITTTATASGWSVRLPVRSVAVQVRRRRARGCGLR